MMHEAVTLDQLRVFVAVVERGGFAAAARGLGRAQSVVSYAIGQLEGVLEVTLFERGGRRATLTAAGEGLLHEARRVLEATQRLGSRAQTLRDGVEAQVALSIDVMFPMPALVEVCAAFRRTFAMTQLALYTEALGAVGARVIETPGATLGVTGPDGLDESRVETRALGQITLIPVVASHHPLARCEVVSDEALREHVQIVLTDRSAHTRGQTRAVRADQTWTTADLHAKDALIRAGLGWGNMPHHLVEDALRTGALVRLSPRAWERQRWSLTLSAIWPRGQTLGPAATWLIEALEGACWPFTEGASAQGVDVSKV